MRLEGRSRNIGSSSRTGGGEGRHLSAIIFGRTTHGTRRRHGENWVFWSLRSDPKILDAD
jgi:hypothetical protein